MENKQEILDLLLPALQATRNLNDLKELIYDLKSEHVIAVFDNNSRKRINVAGDSGTAMIQDIINNIV